MKLLDETILADRKMLDSLIMQMEPKHVTIFRDHYNLPYGSPLVENLTDLEILVDNRRWKYTHGEVDENGDAIVEDDEDGIPNNFDWVDEGVFNEDDEEWMPNNPEFNINDKGLRKMMEEGEIMLNDKAREKMLAAQKEDDEMKALLEGGFA